MKDQPAHGASRRRGGKLQVQTVTLAHGGGGKAMRDLIDDVFVAAFDNPEMGDMEDQARLMHDEWCAILEAVHQAENQLIPVEEGQRLPFAYQALH